MEIRVVYFMVVVCSWLLLPTTQVTQGQNPSPVGFLGFGMVYSIGFMLILRLMGLLKSSLEVGMCIFLAFVVSGLLNLLIYTGGQQSGGRGLDPTFAFCFISFALIFLTEAVLLGRRAGFAASELEGSPSD